MPDSEWQRWKQDRALYPRRAWSTEPAIWAVAGYRFGRWTQESSRNRFIRSVGLRVWRYLHFFTRAFIGIELPISCDIGGGFRIYHQGTIVLGRDVTIGARCRLRQGVTIGVAERGGETPNLGDDVFLGANAMVFGPVTVGDGAVIAAGAVVMKDVPAGVTVGGVPARILSRSET